MGFTKTGLINIELVLKAKAVLILRGINWETKTVLAYKYVRMVTEIVVWIMSYLEIGKPFYYPGHAKKIERRNYTV